MKASLNNVKARDPVGSENNKNANISAFPSLHISFHLPLNSRLEIETECVRESWKTGKLKNPGKFYKKVHFGQKSAL